MEELRSGRSVCAPDEEMVEWPACAAMRATWAAGLFRAFTLRSVMLLRRRGDALPPAPVISYWYSSVGSYPKVGASRVEVCQEGRVGPWGREGVAGEC